MATSDYIEGKTSSGFEYRIEREKLDDWEILEKLSELDGVSSSIYTMKAFLGEEQYNALKEHCRIDGRVSSSRIEEEMLQILADENLKK